MHRGPVHQMTEPAAPGWIRSQARVSNYCENCGFTMLEGDWVWGYLNTSGCMTLRKRCQKCGKGEKGPRPGGRMNGADMQIQEWKDRYKKLEQQFENLADCFKTACPKLFEEWQKGDLSPALTPRVEDRKPREPGCQCHQEEGDSPCAVHGDEEEPPRLKFGDAGYFNECSHRGDPTPPTCAGRCSCTARECRCHMENGAGGQCE